MADVVFPMLLVCGFFSIIILVGILFSYLWLLWLNAEATKCPECGRRGGGELVESEVIGSKTYTKWKDAQSLLGRAGNRRQRIRVTEKSYEDRFECKYCGHQWMTTAQEKKREPV